MAWAQLGTSETVIDIKQPLLYHERIYGSLVVCEAYA